MIENDPDPNIQHWWLCMFYSWPQHTCMTFCVSLEAATMTPLWPSSRGTWTLSSRPCVELRPCSSPTNAAAWSAWTASAETHAGETQTCTRWSRCSATQWTRWSPMLPPICSTFVMRTTASSRRCASWTGCRCWWNYWTTPNLRSTARRAVLCATYPMERTTITKWPSRTVMASKL